jgi:hypothetical protein
MNHDNERQCAACGFTFRGNLAIGSPICSACHEIVLPAVVWACTAPAVDLLTGRGLPWTGPSACTSKTIRFLEQQLRTVAYFALGQHMRRHAYTPPQNDDTYIPPVLRAPSR